MKARLAGVNEHLMDAVLWAAVFFESSSDEECDPDLAVKQLEQMRFALTQLSADEREEFLAYARAVAEHEPRDDIAALVSQIAVALTTTDVRG
jgi:hypothetical protein